MYLIDGDDITCNDFFFLDGFNHFISEVVDGFHFSSFESDFACLSTACSGLFDLDFDNLG